MWQAQHLEWATVIALRDPLSIYGEKERKSAAKWAFSKPQINFRNSSDYTVGQRDPQKKNGTKKTVSSLGSALFTEERSEMG